jgi:hypothetical protein
VNKRERIEQLTLCLQNFLKEAVQLLATLPPPIELRHRVERQANGISISQYGQPAMSQTFVRVERELQKTAQAQHLYEATLRSETARSFFLKNTGGRKELLDGENGHNAAWLRFRAIALYYFHLAGESTQWSQPAFDQVGRRLTEEMSKCTITRLQSIYFINVVIDQPATFAGGLLIRPLSEHEIARRLDQMQFFEHRFSQQAILYSTCVIEQRAEVEPHSAQLYRFPDIADTLEAGLRIVTEGYGGILSVEERIESIAESGWWGPIREPEFHALNKPMIMLTPEHAKALGTFLHVNETSKNGEAVATALRRLNFGVSRERADDSLVDFIMGIESILNVDKGTEITRKISQRMAALIGHIEERVTIHAEMRRLYGRRSKIVHGALDTQSVGDAEIARRYLARLIQSVLLLPRALNVRDLDNAIVHGLGTVPYGSAEVDQCGISSDRRVRNAKEKRPVGPL